MPSQYSLDELKDLLKDLPFSHPVFLVSLTGARRWGLGGFLTECELSGKARWVSNLQSLPTHHSVHATLRELKGFRYDGIVAIGGGSTLDTAKAMSAFHTRAEDSPAQIKRSIIAKTYLDYEPFALPIIAVPSTAGTGSEVTGWATIWDFGGSTKYSLDAHWLKPILAWVVPDLLQTLSPATALAAGLDAVCHATEAYWAKATTPAAQELALHALTLLAGNLWYAIHHLDEQASRDTLAKGAHLAGQAFALTRTTACHAISYPLTAMFNIPHGFACAMTLAPIADLNESACTIDPIRAIFEPFGGIRSWLDHTCEGVTSLRLHTFGIEEADLDAIAAKSFTPGRADNNPVELTVDQVKEILIGVL